MLSLTCVVLLSVGSYISRTNAKYAAIWWQASLAAILAGDIISRLI